jgi:hypothetical protein
VEARISSNIFLASVVKGVDMVAGVGWVVAQSGKGGWDDHKRKKSCSEYQGVGTHRFYSVHRGRLQR